MIKDVLAYHIIIKPDIIQFAKDRKFEDAWAIPRSGSRPDHEVIRAYLDREPFSALIVEYVWGADDDNNRFVLTVFHDKGCRLQNPQRFMEICLDNFYGYRDFSGLIQDLDGKVIGSECLFVRPVDAVNLGVFNHWMSVSPVDLWSKGETLDMEEVGRRIEARPEVARTSLNYQGLFFRYNVSGDKSGPYYGIKTPCCKKEGGLWVVNYEKIGYWMNSMIYHSDSANGRGRA